MPFRDQAPNSPGRLDWRTFLRLGSVAPLVACGAGGMERREKARCASAIRLPAPASPRTHTRGTGPLEEEKTSSSWTTLMGGAADQQVGEAENGVLGDPPSRWLGRRDEVLVNSSVRESGDRPR